MKLLYISSLFSGLENTFVYNQWSPKGVPTVYNFLKKLNLFFPQSEAVFFTNNNEILKKKNYYISEYNLNCHFIYHYKGNNKFLRIYNYIYKLIKLMFICFKINPRFCYFDRSNLLLLFFFKIFTNRIVIWRLMGIPLPMHKFYSKKSINSKLIKLFLKLKINLVICTQDGSGGGEWMDKYLNQKTKKVLLINGFDKYFTTDEFTNINYHFLFNKKFMNILFVSRLVEGKGCMEFIDTIIKLVNAKYLDLRYIIIGDGYLKNKMIKTLNDNNMSKYVTFAGSMPHNEVIKSYKFADIYVSLNEMGSLINTNLEAIKSNSCIIIPKSLNKFNIDKYTDSLLPDNSVIRISRKNISYNLFEKIKLLYNDRTKIKFMKENIESLDKSFIGSWDDRIFREYEIIKNLIK